ncbi:RING-H2 finger protein ATL78-like [Mangifera indica]|uniref:RING-H2 finger protein ATL78-like n=1 Tax=Mangifera indica TaxID=29780 RepID=UPI001CFA9271|nr:RING-H2 finger protein ATL78-like [Mangifera indica]
MGPKQINLLEELLSSIPPNSLKMSPTFQDFPGNSPSRKLLLFNHINQQQPAPRAAAPSSNYFGTNRIFDPNVVMVMSVLLCAVVCALGLNFLIRCIIKRSGSVAFGNFDSTGTSSAKIPNTGIKKKALKTFPVVKYSAEVNLPGLDSECVICLSEFVPGERVRLLPTCNHGFHICCIDKWLKSHSSCPKCRHCLIETRQKIVGCSQPAGSSGSAVAHLPSEQETAVSIRPLEPEGVLHNHGVIC